MKSLFVSYEIAKLLKEKGFNEPTKFGVESSLYSKNGNHCFYANYGVMYSGLSDGYINAPLYQQVVDWFREKHDIHISISCWNLLYSWRITKPSDTSFDYDNTIEMKGYYLTLIDSIQEAFKLIKN